MANENLLFWREGIKYKLSFDRNNDFEYSQQMAKVLWRTFISPHATLPINISDSVKRTIDGRFKGTAVGKTVFDEVCKSLKYLSAVWHGFLLTDIVCYLFWSLNRPWQKCI